MHDATERPGFDTRLGDTQKMAALEALAGGVAHDIQNILTVISICAEMLRGTTRPGDPGMEDILLIVDAVDRARHMAGELTAFARRTPQRAEDTTLDRMIIGLKPMLRRLVRAEHSLVLALDATDTAVRLEPRDLEHALMNLVANARDAMPTSGTVTVATDVVTLGDELAAAVGVAAPGRHVRLRVQDTGIGMTEDVRRRVFEPFFTTKSPGQGTGLGLATVYGFVQRSRGAITCQSGTGGGSEFALYLPVVEGGPEACE
jgi:two-component system cell cycle sensor histidine kinase/response regulator CckA